MDMHMLSGTVVRLMRGLWLLFASPQTRRHALVGHPARWRESRDFQFRLLSRLGLRSDHKMLDIGCGTLRGGIPCIQFLEAGGYTGIEVRPGVLDEARAELAEARLEHKRPHLVCADDLSSVRLGTRFDVIWAYSVLIHMTDPVLEQCLGLVRAHLAPEGWFCANVNLGEKRQRTWYQGFPLVWRSLEFYRQAAARHGLALEDLGTLASMGFDTGHRAQDRKHMLRFRSTGDATGPGCLPRPGG